jgi:hypothetical protein
VNILDLLWLTVVFALPIVIAWRVFTNEPMERFFVASWSLSILGSLFVTFIISLGLAAFDLGIFGIFDGIIILPMSVIVSPIVGVGVRRKRQSEMKA